MREDSLPALVVQWAEEILCVTNAAPYVAVGRTGCPLGQSARVPLDPLLPYISVSLGVGENPAKRIADPFEENLLGLLSPPPPLLLAKRARAKAAAHLHHPVP